MVETLLSMTFQIINFWWLFTIIFHNFRLVLDINSIDKGEYEWKNVYIRNIIKNNSNSSERAKIQDTYIKKAEIFILLIYLDMQFLLFVFTRYILHFLWGGGGVEWVGGWRLLAPLIQRFKYTFLITRCPFVRLSVCCKLYIFDCQI